MAPTPHVLVTGASGGIGAATAIELAANGPVVVHYHSNNAGAEAVVKQIIDAGGKARAFQADLTQAGAAEQLVQAVAAE
jgi:3-oxoacyl-[acyl-carrier protein] reductase